MSDRPILGILGGMGPFASAEFLKTIYEQSAATVEQEMPAVMLMSDPGVPDRTTALLRGEAEQLAQALVSRLVRLRDAGASRTVICCMTMHHVLPRVPASLLRGVISLVDVAVSALYAERSRSLLLCTNGTRAMALFERHPRWPAIAPRVCWPEADDQARVHDLIYRTKQQGATRELRAELCTLLARYDVGSFVAGCTELHLLSKAMAAEDDDPAHPRPLDPLMILAREVATNPDWDRTTRWQMAAA